MTFLIIIGLLVVHLLGLYLIIQPIVTVTIWTAFGGTIQWLERLFVITMFVLGIWMEWYAASHWSITLNLT